MQKVLTCIECPRGCTLTVERQGEEYLVSGNFCPKGALYGKNEVICPVRIVTSTVRAGKTMLPVKTDKAVNKSLMFEVMDKIRKAEVLTSVKSGDLIIENVDGEGTNVISASPYVKEN